MSGKVALPLDSDGFLRRECPNCLRQFKWHNGPASAEAEEQLPVDAYFCPFCGQPAVTDQWFTTEQVEYIQGVAMREAMQAADDELASAFKKMSSKNFQIKKTGHLDIPDQPDPLTEPDDMLIVVSPCHSWEPIKIPDTTAGPLHCINCGDAFAI